MLRSSAAVAIFSLILVQNAQAQFARPPQASPDFGVPQDPAPAGDDILIQTQDADGRDSVSASWLRLQVGPAARFSEQRPAGGLFAAVDIGRAAAGLRLSGTWVRVGSLGGAAQYSAELWLDFVDGGPWHPIVAAGAGVANVRVKDAAGELSDHTVGVGLVRGGVQYALPVAQTDARAAMDVTGALPALDGADAAHGRPWVTVSLSVAVGF